LRLAARSVKAERKSRFTQSAMRSVKITPPTSRLSIRVPQWKK
jgi:hypothetical protein